MGKWQREAYPYTPLFCEENIWRLADALQRTGQPVETMRVLFLCNRPRQVVLFNQRAAAEGEPLVWDYHVVLQVESDDEAQILDFDSRLPFPSRASDYLAATLPHPGALTEGYSITIRAIEAASYLQRFYSTREHMVGTIPVEAFPSEPPITVSGEGVSLPCYWDPDCEPGEGCRDHHFIDYYRQILRP